MRRIYNSSHSGRRYKFIGNDGLSSCSIIYRDSNNKGAKIDLFSVVEVIGFVTPCILGGHLDCPGCIIIEGSNGDPVCVSYGTTYGLVEVKEEGQI